MTAAFMFIRHSTMEKIGLYDEEFFMGWEDVDYCIRAFLDRIPVVYNPNIRGFHHEMKFRGRPTKKLQKWQSASFVHLAKKYAKQSFADFVPQI